MYCDECNNKPASVHLTKIINGNKENRHLCEDCARKYQQTMNISFMPEFSMANFFSDIFDTDFILGSKPKVTQYPPCQTCGLTIEEFKKLGRVGCSDCYSHFGDQVTQVIRRVHGGANHIGKLPTRCGKEILYRQELKELKQQLIMAIDQEEFERAAELRDEIRALEAKQERGEV